MLVTAGNSVDVSGFSSGVNCATGYTKVEFEEVEGKRFCDFGGCMSGSRTVDA